MDLYCPQCGEPWDIDSLHEEAEARYGLPYYKTRDDQTHGRRNPAWVEKEYQEVFNRVRAEFQVKGCDALHAIGGHCEPPSEWGKTRARLASAAYDLLGDDIDGAAAMLEDWEGGY